MRRVSPLLVMSNTIFNVARRGKTLLVTLNTHSVQRGNETTHRSNDTTNMATTQVPSPSLARNASRRGYISFDFPPTSPPSPRPLETRDGGPLLTMATAAAATWTRTMRTTNGCSCSCQHEWGRRTLQMAAAAAANTNEDDTHDDNGLPHKQGCPWCDMNNDGGHTRYAC